MLTRTRILEHVWDFAYDGGSNVVDQYVLYLRRKIDRPFGVEQLETVRGAGYRLRATEPASGADDGAGPVPGRRRLEVGMALRLRLALLFALATAVLIAVAGPGFVLQLRVSLDASLDPGLRARVAALADELVLRTRPGPAVGGGRRSRPGSPLQTGGCWPPRRMPGTRPLLDAAQRRQALTGEASFTADRRRGPHPGAGRHRRPAAAGRSW